MAAVDKIEDQRKPDDFIGHRNRTSAPTVWWGCGRFLNRPYGKCRGALKFRPLADSIIINCPLYTSIHLEAYLWKTRKTRVNTGLFGPRGKMKMGK